MLHRQTHRRPFEPEDLADHRSDLGERVVTVLREEERTSWRLVDRKQVEIGEVIDMDIRIAIEPLAEIDTRSDLLRQSDEFRNLVAVWLQTPAGPVDHSGTDDD